jgi:hypothetical protein
MTHILLLVALPWVLSAALLTCEFSEVLLGSPTRRCTVSCCDQLHIDGVLPVCTAALKPRVAVGVGVVAGGHWWFSLAGG